MVKIHKGLTSQIVKKWDAPIDLLFIDADHDYQSVKEDFEKIGAATYQKVGLSVFTILG